MRHQLPAYSPISARTLLPAYLAASSDANGELQQFLAYHFDAEAVMLCGSGTQALQLALGAAQRHLGAKTVVALPAFTCYDVATAAIAGDYRVVLYDIDPDTLAPDLESVRAALLVGARTIVVSPLYGIPVPWRPLLELAAGFGAVVIEDAAQGQGASHGGRPLGSLGELSVLSFSRGKGWTGGGGGALLLRGSFDIGHVKPFALEMVAPTGRTTNFVKTLAQWVLGRPQLYGIPMRIPSLGLGETRYHQPGSVRHMDPAAAELLLRTVPELDVENEVRVENAVFYTAQLQDQPGIRLIDVPADSMPGYLRFPIRVTGGSAPLQQQNAARLGIFPSYPTTLHALPALRPQLHIHVASCSGADTLAAELMTLPVHSRVTADDRQQVIDTVKQAGDAALLYAEPGNAHFKSAQG